MQKYSNTVRKSFERAGAIGAGIDVPLPTLGDAQSCMAVPALARGELVGVLTVESPLSVAFEDEDEAVLKVIATVVAQMIDIERSNVDAADRSAPPAPAASTTPTSGETHIRFFGEDGSVFLDGEYLIRGVAGRILWSLVQRHVQTGQTEFTNKELRLDRALELPGFRDNLDTRLVMLKRRLDERQAPLRMERTGRGRFLLRVSTSLSLEAHD
jgi:adenylate cyclase